MQKAILLLPLVCLIFCSAQEIGEAQSLIYSQTSNVGLVQLVNNGSSYICPNGLVYLVRDFQVFNGVVCVDTTITDAQIQQGDCSPGWATISFNEVAANTQEYCNMIGGQDVVRIGFMGSLNANDCSLLDFDNSVIMQSICVQRVINDIQLVPLRANICGEGMVPVTQQEALANQNFYCNLLGDWNIVRLADGGSMDGPGYGCKIRYEDRRNLGGVLCRQIQNSDANESPNPNLFDSEVTFTQNDALDPIDLSNRAE